MTTIFVKDLDDNVLQRITGEQAPIAGDVLLVPKDGGYVGVTVIRRVWLPGLRLNAVVLYVVFGVANGQPSYTNMPS